MANDHNQQTDFEYSALDLLTLWEVCTILEKQMQAIKAGMSENDRKTLECYLSTQIEFEIESYKATLNRNNTP